MPLVSIITPCYNSARYIRETVMSVRTQTLTDWEMVIVDDGSKDDPSAEIADLLSIDPRLRLIRKENGGVSSARNLGFRESNAESRYLYFLDADDFPEPTTLEELTKYLHDHEDVGMVYCDPHLVGEDSKEFRDLNGATSWHPERWEPTLFGAKRVPPEVPLTSLNMMFAVTVITPSMSVMRRSIYQQTPGFDESMGHLYEDLDIFIQIALRSNVHHYPRLLINYRQHAAQSTANKDKLWQQEQKLFDKWHESLSREQDPEKAKRIRDALRFRERRIIPIAGFLNARKLFRQGNIIAGLRFLAGAIRRYSFAPMASSQNTLGQEP
jgi:glycosyltransferase involved in cell wall biosynthesis